MSKGQLLSLSVSLMPFILYNTESDSQGLKEENCRGEEMITDPIVE